MHLSATLSFRRSLALAVASILLTISASPLRADEGADAQVVANAYVKFLDRDDVDGAYQKVSEQLKRTTSKGEWLAAMKTWLAAKGGASSARAIVVQRTLSEAEAHQMAPQSTAKGNVYAFRYRSTYPKGVFFEDVYINRDSDGVFRVGGHFPQPAE